MFKRAGVVNIEVKREEETRVRPDIEIILSDRSLLVDVAVSPPSRRSLVQHETSRSEGGKISFRGIGAWSHLFSIIVNPTVLLAVKDWNC
jgi:hypothetical protein